MDVTWMTRGVTQTLLRQVKDEMDGSDRAAAVVGGAFVEEQLTRLLKSRMVKDEKITEEIFGPGRAFGDCPPSPRDRFATACRFYIAAFSILTNQNPRIQEPMF
jgi:hypothetical protein